MFKKNFKKKGFKKPEIQLIKKLINEKSNVELAEILNCTRHDISAVIQRCGIKRDPEFAEKLKHPTGENSHNWKGGRSKDNYFYRKRQLEKFPDKIEARYIVSQAIRKGELIKPAKCSDCGEIVGAKDMHFHHTNGYEPENHLVGIWICRVCHRKLHGGKH